MILSAVIGAWSATLSPAAIEDGRWTPALGDPSLMGWAMVAAYLLASLACVGWATPRGSGRALPIGLAVLLLLLAVNKQLDLQSLLTQTARDLVRELGWYDSHRAMQVGFIVGLAGLAVASLLAAAWWLRRRIAEVWLALLGVASLVAFILIRAASFHRVDSGLGEEIAGMRLNWILELGAIGLSTAGAFLGRASRASAARWGEPVAVPPTATVEANPTEPSAMPAPEPPSEKPASGRSASDAGFVVRPIRLSEGPRRRADQDERPSPVRRLAP